ncbi:MAG TPA: PIN domain nuclease [Spirochaetota bacterium]|nr:PIN domain nuclease [Spirochaetota bacterium]
MINVLRILFIVITTLFSSLFFIRFSISAAIIAGISSAVLALAVIIVIEYVAHTLQTKALVAAITGVIIGLATGLLAVGVISLIPVSADAATMMILKAGVAHLIAFAVMMFFVIKVEDIAIFEWLVPARTEQSNGSISYKILDTSVIIDGRISDICDSGFIEGVLVIPTFVLNELQLIADSADSLKRNRGRRGLDILNKMQKDATIKVKISDIDFQDTHEVDAKLVKLAKVMKAKVITNDFNLNKVAEFHGVEVLNINELSNALKPIVLPSEEMHVSLIKEGKDPNQAIGYLDDGTMVVVENGRKRLHSDVDVVVTSVLQTTAGRMIFARVKDDH